MDAKKLFQTASDIAISEEKTNDIFLTVTMRMFSTRPNRNNEGVTEGFIDEIVANQDKYGCLPLYVDIERLRARNYASLGHRLDRRTGKFDTTQVGGFFAFTKVIDEYGTSQLGEARIPKRESDVCECVAELYDMGMLNFSFEISYSPDAVVVIDGVQYVDVAESNTQTGMTIVSIPAYKESVAFSLVAETEADDVLVDDEGVEQSMTLEEAMKAIEEKDALIAEQTQSLAEKDSMIAEKDSSLAEKDAAIAEKEEEISRMKAEKEDEALKEKEEKDEEKDKMFEELASANQKIAELNTQIAELEVFKTELEAIKAEKAEAELREKQDKAKAFAEKQNLDVSDEAVAKAIAELDYEALATMSMSVEKTDPQSVAVASYGVAPELGVKNRFERILESR